MVDMERANFIIQNIVSEGLAWKHKKRLRF